MNPEFRVFLRKECLINPPAKQTKLAAEGLAAEGLLALFLPKVIEMALSGIASLLKKAGTDETVQASNDEITNFYQTDKDQRLLINEKLGCIIGVFGVFTDKDKKPTANDDYAVLKLEKAELVPKDADISIVFEAAIVPTCDNTAFYLDTRHFSVRDFIGERHKNDRAYVATLTVKTPNVTADGNTIAIGNIDLGRLKRDEELAIGKPGDYPRYLSTLMPWKQISEAAKEAYESDAKRNQAQKRGYMPVTFSLTLSETADGNKFLLKLGELLEGAKAEAAKEISKLILPEEIEKAKKAEADAAEKLLAAEEDAQIEVLKAEAALAAKPDDAVLRAQLEKAKRAKERATRLRQAADLRVETRNEKPQ